MAHSRIVSVALFRDSAQVTRVAELALPAGKSAVRFEGLPTAIDPTALQVSLGDAAGVVRNARASHADDSQDPPATKALLETLESHLRETRRIEEEKRIAQARADFATKMSASFADRFGTLSESGGSLTVAQGLETWELVDRTRRESRQAIEEADASLRQRAQTEIDIRETIRKAAEARAKTRSVAEVEVEMDAAATVSIELSYQALEARWEPRYELRAEPARGAIEFGYFAAIRQDTGEDWRDIELSLLTNSANRRGDVPELSPLRLERAELYSSVKTRSVASFAEAAYKSEAEPPPSKQLAQVAATAVSFQVTLPGAVSAPSSPDESALPVASKTFKAEFWSETAPKAQLSAYLRARAVNELELPILPGQALAFVDGKLSSKVALDKTLPSEQLELSLGEDARIVVTRVEGAQKDQQSGFIDKTVTLRRAYTNNVASYHAAPHKVVVIDQFPIATDAKIEIARIAPKDADVVAREEEKDSGIFRWEATLAPEQKRSFKIEYEIVHPRDWTLYPEL